jgi:predicted nucleotidyltransferase component of viral defense system
VPTDLVELDYALSYVLAALYDNEDLKSAWVFKGGTALHKAYFPDYRFSVDLDFTALGGPHGQALELTMQSIARDVQDRLDQYGLFRVSSARRSERDAHPAGQEAFTIQLRFPWHREVVRSIKIEVTVDEPVLLGTVARPLLHDYGEPLTSELQVYRLGEILAEKLRTPLQAQKRANEGKWTRNCARDYHDLWYLLRSAEAGDLAAAVDILPRKCAVRQVSYSRVDDFFPPLIVSEAERQWTTSLADLVRTLPQFTDAISDLRTDLNRLLSGSTAVGSS